MLVKGSSKKYEILETETKGLLLMCLETENHINIQMGCESNLDSNLSLEVPLICLILLLYFTILFNHCIFYHNILISTVKLTNFFVITILF